MGAILSDPAARDCKVCCSNREDETALLLDADDIDSGREPNPLDTGDVLASVIQFSTQFYYCKEEERVAKVDVVRMGDASQYAWVDYYTTNASAKAGRKYLAQTGTLKFPPSETLQTIEIIVIDDDVWDATLEFNVHLQRSRGAQLGMYLHHARVKIIDDDLFPTNKYKRLLASEETEEEVPSVGLFVEFFKMLLTIPIVYKGTVKWVILDQVKNTYFFLTFWLQMYLIDVVLSPEKGKEHESEGHEEKGEAHEGETVDRRLLRQFVYFAARKLAEAAEGEGEEKEEGSVFMPEVLFVPGNRAYTAIVVGLMYIMPYFLLHYIDNSKFSLDVAGSARRKLQSNLLRKFLNYKEEHRSKIAMGELQMTMVRDVVETVDFGYMKVLVILAIVGKLSLALVFILMEAKLAIVPLLVYPVVMGIFMYFRAPITVEASEASAAEQNQIVQLISDAFKNYRMVADFDLRPFIVDTYEEQISNFNEMQVETDQVAISNTYLPRWLTITTIGCYMMLSPGLIASGAVSLGSVVATINIFKEIGAELAEIYKEFMEIQRSIGPLRKLVHFMNLETDLETRMKINRRRRAAGQQRRMQARGAAVTDKGEAVFAVDMIPIELINLTFGYTEESGLFKNVNVKFLQGAMYAFVGPAHEGKSTLLKLLGQVILPEDAGHGSIFVPPHLRVLHLTPEALLMRSSFLRNIIFNTSVQKVGGLERVKKICKKLRFTDALIAHLKDEDAGLEVEGMGEVFRAWVSLLSHTDFARLNLARALVMNPECMSLHKPTMPFDVTEKHNVLELLRQHVDHKGLELPEEGRKYRRRRTVFLTSVSMHAIKLADVIYEVSADHGVKVMTKGQAMSALQGTWTM